MDKNTVFIILSMILLSISVYANEYCPDDKCSNQFSFVNGLTSSPILTMSGSSYPSFQTANATWSVCNAGVALNKPISFDIDDDHVNEVVYRTSQTHIVAYDPQCVLKREIFSDNGIAANLRLTDVDFDGKFELVVLTNSTLDVYDRNGTRISSFKYQAALGSTDATDLACTDAYCWVALYTTKRMLVFDMTETSFITGGVNITLISNASTGAKAWLTTPQRGQGVGGYAQEVNGVHYASFCTSGIAASDSAFCDVFNNSGDRVFETAALVSFGSRNNVDVPQYTAGFVKMGNQYRYVASAMVDTTPGPNIARTGFKVYDTNFNLLLNEVNTPFNVTVSDVSVSDIDRDGITELCYLRNYTDADYPQEFMIVCWTNAFISAKYNFTVNISLWGMTQPPWSIAFVDYNSSNGPLRQMATKEGVVTASAPYQKLLSTNLTLDPLNDKVPINYLDDNQFSIITTQWLGNPVLFYGDSSASTILSSVLTTSTCGDGICFGSEDEFTCPQDCLSFSSTPFNGTCVIDSDCIINTPTYPKCLNGTCVSGYNGLRCSSYLDCPPNASICTSGFCVSGYFGTLPPGTATADQTEYQSSINHWIDYLLGSSSFIKMVIAIIIIVAAMGLTYGFIAQWTQNVHPIFPLIAGLGAVILCTTFGLIPIWFIILIILSGISVWLLLRLMLNPGSSGQ